MPRDVFSCPFTGSCRIETNELSRFLGDTGINFGCCSQILHRITKWILCYDMNLRESENCKRKRKNSENFALSPFSVSDGTRLVQTACVPSAVRWFSLCPHSCDDSFCFSLQIPWRRLHLVNPAASGPVCSQLRGFALQTAVAGVPRAVPARSAVRVPRAGRVDGRLPPRGNVLDLWPGWLRHWWLSYCSWQETLRQCEWSSDVPL